MVAWPHANRVSLDALFVRQMSPQRPQKFEGDENNPRPLQGCRFASMGGMDFLALFVMYTLDSELFFQHKLIIHCDTFFLFVPTPIWLTAKSCAPTIAIQNNITLPYHMSIQHHSPEYPPRHLRNLHRLRFRFSPPAFLLSSFPPLSLSLSALSHTKPNAHLPIFLLDINTPPKR